MNEPARSQTDIAIVGAGLAGSAAALVLARQGHRVVVVDPDQTYPPDFRCEKLSSEQLGLIKTLGLEDAVAQRSSDVGEILVARGGRPVDLKTTRERGLRYDTLVNVVRQAWPSGVAFHEGRVDDITPDPHRPSIRLHCGEVIDAKLVILATGPGEKLRAGLGLQRRIVRTNQSICIGFDLVTSAGNRLSDRALTYYGERAGDGMAFATFFPIGDVTRCNVFCHLDPKQLFVQNVRKQPLQRLFEVMPGLHALLGDVVVRGGAEMRVTHLYETDDPQRDGVVLIGDAVRASCPVTGTGVSRVLTDVDRLCHEHIPAWFAEGNVDAARIARFYADRQKIKVDANSAAKAQRERLMSLSTALPWRARRQLALAKSRLHALLVRQGTGALALRGRPSVATPAVGGTPTLAGG